MKRPQLAIRDLFWLILVAALTLGWWADRRAQAERFANLIKEVNRLEIEKFQWQMQRTQSGWSHTN